MDIDKLLSDLADREKCQKDDICWYAWPQVFGNTAGPAGGIGGAMMTTFQVIAFECPNGKMVRWCAGRWRRWNGEFQQEW